MNESLRMRLGAVTLALLTVAAIVFAVLNFEQRSRFVVPEDGVTWMETAQGVVAWHVVPGSPAERAGLRRGDYVESVRGVRIEVQTRVPFWLSSGSERPTPGEASRLGMKPEVRDFV